MFKVISNKSLQLIFVSTIILALVSCKKLISIDTPLNQLTPDKVYADSASVAAVLSNLYSYFERSVNPSLQISASLYADELNYYGSDPATHEFFRSSVSVQNQSNKNIWSRLYKIIYYSNDLLEQIPNAKSLSEPFKNSVLAEAFYFRAYAYFQLVNLYENIPLILKTDVITSTQARQFPLPAIYEQIEKDLLSSKALFAEVNSNVTNTRVSQFAVSAVLSKVFLFQKKWLEAETEADAIITSNLFKLEVPEDVFTSLSEETIFQIWTPQGYNYNTPGFILSSNSVPQYSLSLSLVQSFAAGDLRKELWIGSKLINDGNNDVEYYYLTKYHNVVPNTSNPEYLVMHRLAEQYLITAQAKAEQGDYEGSALAINKIRDRAGLDPLDNLNTLELCQTAIIKERRSELFMEDTHRFFDLKKSGQLNQVIGELKPSWLSRADKLPIPRDEILANSKLSQNQDY